MTHRNGWGRAGTCIHNPIISLTDLLHVQRHIQVIHHSNHLQGGWVASDKAMNPCALPTNKCAPTSCSSSAAMATNKQMRSNACAYRQGPRRHATFEAHLCPRPTSWTSTTNELEHRKGTLKGHEGTVYQAVPPPGSRTGNYGYVRGSSPSEH